MMATTGIAVFAYDRPDHLTQVLDGLKRNDVDHLYVFSDGPANSSDLDRVTAVRDVIDGIDWCSKTVVARNENLGVAQSVISGVERVFEDHERLIAVEDDCVPAPNFVKFIKTCLDTYADVDRVMNVTGYSPPIEVPDDYPYDVYFTRRPSPWGWGTWKSAWEAFEHDPVTLDELERNEAEFRDVVDETGKDVYQMMKDQLTDQIDTWGVWWGYAIAKRDGLCLTPVQSKTKNIGHDDEGTHTSGTDKFKVTLDETPVAELEFPAEPFVHEEIHDRYTEFVGGGRWYPLRRRLADGLKTVGLWDLYRAVRHS